MKQPRDFLPLTPLSHAIMLALADGALHGYAMMKAIEEQSAGQIRPGTGTLYAALQRLIEEGLIRESTRRPGQDEDARRRYYDLTELGRSVARAEARRIADVLALARQKRLGPVATRRGGA